MKYYALPRGHLKRSKLVVVQSKGKLVKRKNRKALPHHSSRKLWSFREFMLKRNNFHLLFMAKYLPYVKSRKRIGKNGSIWMEFEARNMVLLKELEGLSEKLNGFIQELNIQELNMAPSSREVGLEERARLSAEINARMEAFLGENNFYGKLYSAYRKLVALGAKNLDLVT